MKEQFEKEPQESVGGEVESRPDAAQDSEVSAEKAEQVTEHAATEQSPFTASDSHHHHHHHYHHHHHHHHRHHSSRRYSTRRNKLNGKAFAKIWAFLTKNRKIIGYIALALVLINLMMVGAVLIDHYLTREPVSNNGEDQTISETQSTIQLEIPVFVDSVSLANRGVVDYMSAPITETVNSFWRLYRDHIRMDVPLPVKLQFSVKGLPAGLSIDRIEILVSKDEAFSTPRVYSLDKDDRSVNLYNLETASTYYFRIELIFSVGQSTFVQGSFTTKDTPRLIYVDGAVNVRDIGGWKTVDGKTVRQGLLYRGSELDGAVESNYRITEDGLVEMLSVLGVQTDMDLREKTVGVEVFDALGSNVTHTYYNSPMYAAVFEEANYETVRKIFSDLAKKEAYPVYLHCTYGRDRTGTVCYLLEALLGLSEDDLWREYELSAFKDGYINEKEMSAFVTTLKHLEGETLQDKAEGYLKSIGVTNEEIASIRDIFLEN